MKLNIPERLALLQILPNEGNIATLRIVRELQSELSFSEEEMKHYGIQNHQMPDGGATITWNPEMSNEQKDINIGEATKGVIVAQLRRLNEMAKLHISMIPLYEKFVEKS